MKRKMKMLLGLVFTTSMVLLTPVYSYSDVQENINEVIPEIAYDYSEEDVDDLTFDQSNSLDDGEMDVGDIPEEEEVEEKIPYNPPPVAQTHEPNAYAIAVTRADGAGNPIVIRYSEGGLIGSEVRLYTFDGMNYTMLFSQIAYNNDVVFTISDSTIFDKGFGGFYISLI